MLTDAAINTYFNEQKETILYCDANPFGLSSILLQNDNKDHLQVISHSSRSLNTTEQRYSQLERECLSIVYAYQRHRVYLFGRTFKIYSDNKALVRLLSRPSSKVPLRTERLILQLQGYDFDIKFVKTQQNISDYISRHPDREQKLIESAEVDKYVNFVTSTAVPRLFTSEDIATAAKQDKVLQILKQTILNNEWKSMDKKQYDVETLKLLKQYQKFKELLTVNIQYDIILKDHRIVLPTIFHRTAVKLAHVGHQGVQKTKALMRSKVFFIGMDKAIEDEINNCIACQSTGRPTPPAKIQPSLLPNEVWDTLNVDFLGPLPNGKYVFAIMDQRSRFPFAAVTASTSAKNLIKVFHVIFGQYGYPRKSLATMGHCLSQRK